MSASVLMRATCVWLGLLAILGSSCRKATEAAPGLGPKDKIESTRFWYERSLVGMEVGPTGAQFGHSNAEDSRYCSNFDGRQIVRLCLSAHCDYLVVWARDGDYAYYDSKLLPKAPGLGKRDALRETMEEAQKHNLPVIAYCVVQSHQEVESRCHRGLQLPRQSTVLVGSWPAAGTRTFGFSTNAAACTQRSSTTGGATQNAWQDTVLPQQSHSANGCGRNTKTPLHCARLGAVMA